MQTLVFNLCTISVCGPPLVVLNKISFNSLKWIYFSIVFSWSNYLVRQSGTRKDIVTRCFLLLVEQLRDPPLLSIITAFWSETVKNINRYFMKSPSSHSRCGHSDTLENNTVCTNIINAYWTLSHTGHKHTRVCYTKTHNCTKSSFREHNFFLKNKEIWNYKKLKQTFCLQEDIMCFLYTVFTYLALEQSKQKRM